MFIYELVSLTTLGWAGVASSSARYLGDAAARRARVAPSRPLNFRAFWRAAAPCAARVLVVPSSRSAIGWNPFRVARSLPSLF